MKKLIFLLILLQSFSALFAEIPDRPVPPKLVNDFAGVLSQSDANTLETKLVQFARETSTQIVLVTVPDLEGYDVSDYAFRIGEKWGVGQQDKNNGLVILVKPKTGNEQGRVFIATGYGLEGVLPDAVVNGTVIDKEMIPYFKQNDYYRGIEQGTNVIMDIARGEYTAEYYQQNNASEGSGIPIIIILILIFIIIPAIRGRQRRFYSPGKELPFWLALSMMSGKRPGGSFGDFSSGRGSFGGGGFGGFGGGSFGGGGAGGSW